MWRKRKNQNENEPVGLGLDEVLAALSQDLVHASDATLTRGGGYGLGVERAEVELSVTVVKEASGTAEATTKVRVLPWGMSAGVTGHAGLNLQNSYIHRVTLALIPVVANSVPSTSLTSEAAATSQEIDKDVSIWNTYQSRHGIDQYRGTLNPTFVSPAQEPYVPGSTSPRSAPPHREVYSPGTGRPVAEGFPSIRRDVQAKTDPEKG